MNAVVEHGSKSQNLMTYSPEHQTHDRSRGNQR
jgi:hypothetical protein